VRIECNDDSRRQREREGGSSGQRRSRSCSRWRVAFLKARLANCSRQRHLLPPAGSNPLPRPLSRSHILTTTAPHHSLLAGHIYRARGPRITGPHRGSDTGGPVRRLTGDRPPVPSPRESYVRNVNPARLVAPPVTHFPSASGNETVNPRKLPAGRGLAPFGRAFPSTSPLAFTEALPNP
jgi:hypothetical protein